MHSYELTGGPCHWDLHLRYYVAVGLRLARARGAIDGDNNINRDQLTQLTVDLLRKLTKSFNKFFNPDIADGAYKLYELDPCCSFHIDAKFEPLPTEWTGKSKDEIKALLPADHGVLIVEKLNVTENPHASIGGQFVTLDVDEVSSHTLAHEIAHNLGLEDKYSHPAVPALGVEELDLPDEVEDAHEGRLMGKPKNGRRELHADEVALIARKTGMTCDASKCCPPPRKGEQTRERGVSFGGTIEIF